MVLDVVYQIIVGHFVYPGEVIVVALWFAIVPYLLVRGLLHASRDRSTGVYTMPPGSFLHQDDGRPRPETWYNGKTLTIAAHPDKVFAQAPMPLHEGDEQRRGRVPSRRAPAGAIIVTLPANCTSVRVGNATYTQCGPTYYTRVATGYPVVVLKCHREAAPGRDVRLS